MIKSTTSLFLISAAVLMLLGGCNKTAENSPKIDGPTAPAAPDKPDTPAAVSAEQSTPPSDPVDSPGKAAAVGASVSASGTEARAGDVSVKLPE